MYTRNLTHLLLLIFAACSTVLAYPYEQHIGPRATTTSSNADKSGTTAAPSSMQTTTGPKSTSSASGSASDSNSKSNSQSSTGSGSTSGSKTSTSTSTIDSEAAAGEIVMQTPAATATTQYYKIGDYVTFGWNYTNLLTKPTLKVQAYCQTNNLYFDIASNLSVSQKSVVWNTSKTQEDQSRPFIEAFYNLIIFDQSNPAQVSATASAGELEPFTTLKFGMYSKTAYTPLASYQCATCDKSAASSLDMRGVYFALGLGLVTAFSFACFVNGAL